MTRIELRLLKEQMVQKMIHVHGAHYTIGWLTQAYADPSDDVELDEAVVVKTLAKLDSELEKRLPKTSP